MLQINVRDCSGELKALSCQFASQLASGGLSELGALNLKIAKAGCSGSLHHHPVAMGIMLQCLDYIGRQERGVLSMKHPRKMNDVEAGMVSEAALLLATNGCSASLMRDMGFSKVNTLRSHGRVEHLRTEYPLSGTGHSLAGHHDSEFEPDRRHSSPQWRRQPHPPLCDEFRFNLFIASTKLHQATRPQGLDRCSFLLGRPGQERAWLLPKARAREGSRGKGQSKPNASSLG